MQQRPVVMSPAVMIAATERARGYERSVLKRAEEMKTDPRKVERLKRCECRACYYLNGSRIGGAAMTDRPCMCCGKVQHYSSTATDVLCMSCAEKHKLCKRCGGDVEMKVRRKGWPEAELPKGDEG